MRAPSTQLSSALCLLISLTMGWGAPRVLAQPRGESGDECQRPTIDVSRKHTDERAQLQLTRCDGSPNLAALTELSLLARPSGAERPSQAEIDAYARANPELSAAWVVTRIRRLHPDLLTRLAAISAHFEGRGIEISSGYRPNANPGSRHRIGRALDIGVVGIDRRAVARWAAANFVRTGVGYYPNSSFTHIDIRDHSYQWVDISGPGASASYLAWPSVWPTRESARSRVARAEYDPRERDELPSPPAQPAQPSASRRLLAAGTPSDRGDTLGREAWRARIAAALHQGLEPQTPSASEGPAQTNTPQPAPAPVSRIEVISYQPQRQERPAIDWDLPW